MSEMIEYRLNKATEAECAEHLLQCDVYFVPPLSGRVAIGDYSKKLANMATRFEAWVGNTLVGLVAAYCNDKHARVAYITSVSVLPAWKGKGIASRLIDRCIEHAELLGMRQITLDVAQDNIAAIKLYEKYGFARQSPAGTGETMNLFLKGQETR
jgi:ribosomal protein S18 acetylase RimI-like enzyme